MHELSICQALLEQVESIAREHHSARIERIVLRIGPLSGVEAPLLKQAYPLAAAGTVAEHARLDIESMPVRIRCRSCSTESEVAPNRLLCAACGDYRTDLISGDEMLLARVELLQPEAASSVLPAPSCGPTSV